MSDAQARASGPARRNPWPYVAAAVLLAFLAGLALMAIASGRYRWLPVTPTPAASPRPAVATVVPVRQTATPPSALLSTATDPATLANREAILGAQIASLEARLASVNADAAAASGQAGRAEAMLLAFAARRAVDRGLGLGDVERSFRARFAAMQPHAVALIVAAARSPITLEELRIGLDAVAPTLTAGGADWWSGLRGGLRSLIVLHRSNTPSPMPADRLARVRRLLDAGQVEAALPEVGRMPGASGAANWIAAAHRYADVHRALDAVEAAALASPPPLPTAPVQAPVTIATP